MYRPGTPTQKISKTAYGEIRGIHRTLPVMLVVLWAVAALRRKPGSTDRLALLRGEIHVAAGFGSTDYENVIEPCRALSRRDPVNLVVVRPNRHGSLANRAEFPSAQRHGHGAGAKGEAAAEAGADGKLRGSSSERTGRPDGGSNSGRDAVGCAGSCHGKACQARERGQQLQRWL